MTVHDRIEKIKKGALLDDFEDKDITYGMCLAAVEASNSDYILLSIPERFFTEKICFNAVCNNSNCITTVPEKFLTSDFIKKLVKTKGADIADCLPKECKTDSLLLPAVKAQPDMLWHLPKYARTEAVCMAAVHGMGCKTVAGAIRKEPRLLGFFPTSLYDHDSCLLFVKSDSFKTEHSLSKDCLSFCYDEIEVKFGKYRPVYCASVSVKHLLRWVDVCKEAFKTHPMLIKYANDKVLTPKICESAVKLNPRCLRYIPDRFITKKMCIEAVASESMAFEYVPERFVTSDMCEYAVQKNPYNLDCVPDSFKNEKIYMIAFNNSKYLIDSIPEEYITYQMCLEAVKDNGDNFIDIPKRYITKELCLIALANARMGFSFGKIPKEFVDKEFVLAAIENHNHKVNDWFFNSFIPEDVLDYDICLAGAKKDGLVIRYIPEKYITEEICICAVKNYIWSIVDIPKEKLTYNICLEAVKCAKVQNQANYWHRPWYCEGIPAKFFTEELIKAAIENDALSVFNIPYKELSIESLVLVAQISPRFEKHIPECLKTSEFVKKLEEAKKANN